MIKGILKAIFSPKDGSRQSVVDDVAESRARVSEAANRFEETVCEMIHRNDKLTGRNRNAQLHSPR